MATNIGEVIHCLDQIIDQAYRNQSRLGYFPALYIEVTGNIRRASDEGVFAAPQRMERFAVLFANRYLEALERYQCGQPVLQSWRIAFDAAPDRWLIVLQHLLLAINAHINLDLGIAAARTGPGEQLGDLKSDFDKVNQILSSMVEEVERGLARIWPLLGLLDRVAGNIDETIINFSIEKARDQAWELARRLAALDEAGQRREIEKWDRLVAALGNRIRRPGLVKTSVLRFIRLGEIGTVPEIIDILRNRSARVGVGFRR